MTLGDIASLLLGRRRDARHRIAVGVRDRDRIADGEDIGMARHGEVGFDLQAAGAIGRRAEPFGGGRGATPAAQISVFGCEKLAAIDHAVGRTFGDGLSEHHLDADFFQRRLRIGRQIVGEARQHARAGLDQHDAGLVGVDVAEVRRQRVLRQFGDGAGEFDAGRAARR